MKSEYERGRWSCHTLLLRNKAISERYIRRIWSTKTGDKMRLKDSRAFLFGEKGKYGKITSIKAKRG